MKKVEDILHLFEQLDGRNIQYCHWKSNVRLEEALKGLTDLDVLVSESDKAGFDEVVQECGFREVVNPPENRFPGLHDFIAIGVHGECYHLHVHYRVVFGHKSMKEYHVPMEDVLLAGERRLHGVRVPPVDGELLVHVLRLSVKSFSAIALMRAAGSSRTACPSADDLKELVTLTAQVEREAYGQLIESLSWLNIQDVLLEIYDSSEPPSGRLLNQVADGLSDYKWRSQRSLLAISAFRFYRRFSLFFFRSIFSRRLKKRFVGRGVTVAIVGADGCGKTTVVDAVEKVLASRLAVRRYYLGSNLPGVLSRTYRIFTLPIKAVFLRISRVTGGRGRFIADALLLGQEKMYLRDRRIRMKKGEVAADNGEVVILERYPVSGVQDSAVDLFQDGFSGLLVSARQKLVDVYNQFPGPDVLVYLQVSADVAIARKPDHSEDVIKRKVLGMDRVWGKGGFNVPDDKAVVISAELDADEVARRTLEVILGAV